MNYEEFKFIENQSIFDPEDIEYPEHEPEDEPYSDFERFMEWADNWRDWREE